MRDAPDTTEALDPALCNEPGGLVVDGRVVGTVRCTQPRGHDVDGWFDPWGGVLTLEQYAEHTRRGGEALAAVTATPHVAALEWPLDEQVAAAFDWPEAFDADEVFDTAVEIAEGQRVDGQIDAHREARDE